MKDLQNPKLMWLKAVLFLLIGFCSAGLLVAQSPTLQTALLLALLVWSFCRAYYFAFYVIEKYADPSFRYAGLFSLVRHVRRKRSR